MQDLIRATWLLLLIVVPLCFTGCGGGDSETATTDAEGSLDDVGTTDDDRIASIVRDPAAKIDLADLAGANRKRTLVETKPLTEKYGNEQPKLQGTVKIYDDGTYDRHGPYKEWHPNGKLWIQGEYNDGRETGVWKFWSEDGTLAKSGQYDSQARLDGVWTFHHPDGKRRRVENYSAGVKQGEFITYDPSGQHPITRQLFSDGKLNGTSTGWHNPQSGQTGPGPKRIEASFLNGLRHGTMIEWYPDGQKKRTVEFRNGKQHGKLIEWDQQGKKITEREFRDGDPVD